MRQEEEEEGAAAAALPGRPGEPQLELLILPMLLVHGGVDGGDGDDLLLKQ